MARTYGETTDCNGCRYWSEMVAQALGGGPVQALCLSGEGPMAGKYTSGRQTCAAWASGHHGAVDEPPNYGEEVRAAYAHDDAIVERGLSDIMLIDAAKDAVDFLRSFFGPVASDNPEGWSDDDARKVHDGLEAALARRLAAAAAMNADVVFTDEDWEAAMADNGGDAQ